jgi:molecular chaperone DnaK (HSP70)
VSPELSANTPLTEGRGVIDGIPPQPPGRYARVDIAMSIDEDGLLMLHATEAETGRSLEIRVRVGLSDQEVDDAVAAVSTIAVSG